MWICFTFFHNYDYAGGGGGEEGKGAVYIAFFFFLLSTYRYVPSVFFNKEEHLHMKRTLHILESGGWWQQLH